MKIPAFVLLLAAASQAAVIQMDSARGDRLLESQGCVQCHKFKGIGAGTAPDFGRVLDRGYTPADLVSAMWNHAPTMWATIKAKGVKTGDIDEQAAADLFAAFLSVRYFEAPGDAGRGKRLFEARTCSACHGLTSSPNPAAKPINQWQTLTDPAGIVGAMWNHSPDMRSELAKSSLKWPELSPQDLSDLLVYLRNAVRPAHAELPGFRVSQSAAGADLFQSKGCIACHPNAKPPSRMTLTAVAAAMWNHASLLKDKAPRIDADEMRALLGYYWGNRFLDVEGNAAHGRKLFRSKHCVTCHAGAGPGPDLAAKAGSYTAVTMLSALWGHGPDMLARMKDRKIAWPTFKAGEMEDLIAALNEKKAR
ncbi:MAG: c-type cytochrome [Acidobacteriota bacterium]|nr:c-type cytochrome [Acidobacteriota bacterium]